MTGKAGSQIARSCSGAPHIHSADRAPFAEDNCASCQPFEVTGVTDADAWNRLVRFRFLESDHPDILHFAGLSSGEKWNRFELCDRLGCGPVSSCVTLMFRNGSVRMRTMSKRSW
jgi:hypothetical protein